MQTQKAYMLWVITHQGVIKGYIIGHTGETLIHVTLKRWSFGKCEVFTGGLPASEWGQAEPPAPLFQAGRGIVPSGSVSAEQQAGS